MKYVVIRSVFNQVIDADTDLEAWEQVKAICTKPQDKVFVVKLEDLVGKG